MTFICFLRGVTVGNVRNHFELFKAPKLGNVIKHDPQLNYNKQQNLLKVVFVRMRLIIHNISPTLLRSSKYSRTRL